MVGDSARGEVHPRARAALHLQLHHAKVEALGQKKGSNLPQKNSLNPGNLVKFYLLRKRKEKH
jgi:hypothetical protein